MAVSCPSCRAEVQNSPVFEQRLDQTIEEAVSSVPDCTMKKEWVERRANYLTIRRARAAMAEKASAPTVSTAFAFAGDDLHIGLDTNPFEDYARTGFWVVALGFLTLALISAMRTK